MKTKALTLREAKREFRKKKTESSIRSLQARYDRVERQVKKIETLVKELRDMQDELDLQMTAVIQQEKRRRGLA